jgi:predicted transcriptional regulator
MNVLLSIKPEFADKIFTGEKRFEFRRVIFKNREVKRVFVYASAPISMVIGEFEIEDILAGELGELWEQTKKHAGITENYFLDYFEGRESGYAIKVKKTNRYSTPHHIEERFGVTPPQSFVYV